MKLKLLIILISLVLIAGCISQTDVETEDIKELTIKSVTLEEGETPIF